MQQTVATSPALYDEAGNPFYLIIMEDGGSFLIVQEDTVEGDKVLTPLYRFSTLEAAETALAQEVQAHQEQANKD